MPTEKLFRTDPYMKNFSATVISCEEKNGKFLIELDKTCFYPEGGGQNSDTGRLGSAVVSEVHEKDEVILHYCDCPLTIGSEVCGEIDWQHRFSLMQHHTGEHIVSGIVNRLHGLDNVGFHMGSAMVTVDFNGELDREQIEEIELLANRAVFANIAINESYPSPEELAVLEYRSKKALTGEVRIIEIPDIDRCACCGTHVARTGEVGLIKLLSPTRNKGGIRIGILCGERALNDYRQKDNDTAEISRLLSAKQHETPQAVRRIMAQLEETKAALATAQAKLFEERLKTIDLTSPTVCLFEEGLTPNDLRKFGCLLQEKCSGIAALFSGEEGNYRYAIAAKEGDARTVSKEMHGVLGGKGGGQKELTQGSVSAAKSDIEQFFSTLK
ncbi:MAG: alanyl-tRNA editing protein [Oscillospiraceae bacterium]|nr:alanyl-tRNA editing protein [Oscillospiraceae bacterium]